MGAIDSLKSFLLLALSFKSIISKFSRRSTPASNQNLFKIFDHLSVKQFGQYILMKGSVCIYLLQNTYIISN